MLYCNVTGKVSFRQHNAVNRVGCSGGDFGQRFGLKRTNPALTLPKSHNGAIFDKGQSGEMFSEGRELVAGKTPAKTALASVS